ncbi:AAA family ATPase [Pedococcus sp. NPDC057267]|uniref:AAA family ATPase n=1 Tax=Pedococcus sp. NPDC057267 TaxID=3346077 RepID=UPI0036355D4E
MTTPSTIPGPDPFGSVPTNAFQKAQAALAATVAVNDIAAVYGPPGSGKTHAVRHFIDNHPAMEGRASHWLQMSYRPTPKELAVRLTREFGANPGRKPQYELTDLIVEHLTGSNRVIVIDEAHHLPSSGLQYLRYLKDRGGPTWTLVIVGSDIDRALKSAGELRSRVSSAVGFGPLTGANLLTALRQLHPSLAALDNQTLRDIDNKFPRGNFRDWVHFTRHATRLAAGGAITPQVIAATLSLCLGANR